MGQLTRRDLVKAAAVASAGVLSPNGLVAEGIGPEQAGKPQAHPVEVQVNVAKNELRERQSLDFGWRFALGHACDPARDFGFGKLNGTGTYAKSGDAGGATGIRFDDSKWDEVQVPHDWAVALPFVVEQILVGHGGKPVGRDFPESSIGWYRREIEVKPEDQGKRMVPCWGGGSKLNSAWWVRKKSSPSRTGMGSPGGSLRGNLARREKGPRR